MRNFQEFLNENRKTLLNEVYSEVLTDIEHGAVQLAYITELLIAAQTSCNVMYKDVKIKDYLSLSDQLNNSMQTMITTIARFQAKNDLEDEIPDTYKVQPSNENEKVFVVKMNKKIFK